MMGKRTYIFRFINALLFLLISVSESFAQLQVIANNNATTLAQTLAGPAVVVSGATLNTTTGASGLFNGTTSNLGIPTGILLTTGQATNAVGPNNVENAGTDNQVSFSDPNLIAIEPEAKYDPCILEFDAVPSCSTLVFTFCFASEEYPEYVNKQHNDVFGIFVSGPNPVGPPYSGYNMALIPSTPTPVSVNNVNNGFSLACPGPGPGANVQYFVENCKGTSVQYDGFTKPFTATLNVEPCKSYHFKLAIADAGDGKYDSGVFFLAQSLACNPMPILIATTSKPSSCIINDGSATASPTGGTAPYTYAWSTTPVQTTQTATGLAAGNYTVSVFDVTGCFYNTGTITVTSTGSFPTTESHINVRCFGNTSGSITVTPKGGTSPYTYSWSTTPVQTGASISSIPAGNYTCIVADAHGCTQTQTVTVTQPPQLTASITDTINVKCPNGKDGSATALAGGGVSPYNYSWSTFPHQAGPTANNLTAGDYTVTVTDANNCTLTKSVTITQPALMVLPVSTTTATCGLNDASATITPTGGIPPYTYLWLTSPAVQTTSTASDLGVGNYTVIVTDSRGCLQNRIVTIPGIPPPNANFYFSPTVVSLLDPTITFQDASTGMVSSYMWNFGDSLSGVNDTSSFKNSLHVYLDTGKYCITHIVYSPSGLCSDTTIKCLKVEAPATFYIPNTFTPNGDNCNEIFKGYGTYIKEFKMDIFDRWGNLLFESRDINTGWNGKIKDGNNVAPEDVYVWKVKIVFLNTEERTYMGQVILVK